MTEEESSFYVCYLDCLLWDEISHQHETYRIFDCIREEMGENGNNWDVL